MSSFFDLPFEEPEEAAPDPPPPPPPVRRILTVAELTAEIRLLLEKRFFEVWVEGELSGCRVWTTGHLYFSLTDGGAHRHGETHWTHLEKCGASALLQERAGA